MANKEFKNKDKEKNKVKQSKLIEKLTEVKTLIKEQTPKIINKEIMVILPVE